MSATTGTPAATPLKILKNEYFTHTDGSHRDQRQIWNVGEMAIVVQGIESTDRIQTYFAKKHLLTFDGFDQPTDKTPGSVRLRRKIVK